MEGFTARNLQVTGPPGGNLPPTASGSIPQTRQNFSFLTGVRIGGLFAYVCHKIQIS